MEVFDLSLRRRYEFFFDEILGDTIQDAVTRN